MIMFSYVNIRVFSSADLNDGQTWSKSGHLFFHSDYIKFQLLADLPTRNNETNKLK